MPRVPPALIALAALLACQGQPPPADDATPVTVFAITAPLQAPQDRYSASVEPYASVRVAAQVDGLVVAIPEVSGADGPRELQGGDRVRAGDVLAWIESDTYEQKVERAQAELADQVDSSIAAKDEYERFAAAGEAVAQAQVENTYALWQSARAKVARAEHSLEEARIELDRCTVVAPVDGLLLSRDVEVGDLAGKGVSLFQLADTRRMKIVFAVPAAVAAGLEDGQVLTVNVAALDARQFAGPITRRAPSADPRSRLFDVELTVANPDDALEVGMIGTLELPAAAFAGGLPADAVLVPLDAVVRPPGRTEGFAVYVLDGPLGAERAAGAAAAGGPSRAALGGATTVSLRPVTVGEVLGAEVLVLEGLAAGDRVVVRGSTLVRPGASVRVIP